jgi:hypothetical protein
MYVVIVSIDSFTSEAPLYLISSLVRFVYSYYDSMKNS